MKDKTALDLSDRKRIFTALEAETFDMLVIGAGITGCGIAREAAMRGLRVALVEAVDIASGTSSRSSKLIHGGLRYLAQGQLNVVREAANERRTLRKIAPHLSLTNPMVVLTRSKKGIAAFRTAMWTYEKMGKVAKNEHHQVWDKPALIRNEPAVLSDDRAGAVVYPEYLTDDTRLTLGNARSAAAYGAVVATYATVEKLIFDKGNVGGVVVGSTLPGADQKVEIKARIVVNSAGPWVDAVRRLEDEKAKTKLQLTKGIHLVFSRERLPINRSIIFSSPDKRSLFAVPRGQFAYIGTTDTFYADPQYWPEITPEDVTYLLDSANGVFAVDPLKRSDVVALWSGLRPLLGAKGKKPSEISRRDEVFEGPGGMLAVAGGKLTSYRSMAERLVTTCEKKLGRKPNPAPTGEEPLPGGDFSGTFEELKSTVEKRGLEPHVAERAARLYGSEALDIFAQGHGPAVEAAFAVKNEGALTLEDYWVRRSSRIYFDENGGLASLEPAADTMAELLGWNEEEKRAQLEHCRAKRSKEMEVLDDPS